MISKIVLAAAVAAGFSVATAAQGAPPAVSLDAAFLTALKACVANVQGKLPLNPPSRAQTDAGLVLADPAGAGELKPFADLSPRERMFAAVNSSPGAVVIAEVASRKLCRVVVLDVSDITPVTAAVGPLAGDWKTTLDDPQQNLTVYKGTLLGSPQLTIRIRKPLKDSPKYGDAVYMFTVIAGPS